MIHSFDTYVARKCGMLEAVILRHIEFWCKKNAFNNHHIHNGKVWTYNSLKAFECLFPEASKDQIRRALESLISNGYIEVDNFNEDKRNRTKWYTLTIKYFELLKTGQIADLCNWQNAHTHLADLPNIIGEPAKCTPYNNTDNNIQINTTDNNTPYDFISTPKVVDTKSFPQGGCESESPKDEISEEVFEEVSNDELTFEKFRKVYRGTKRGLKTEFENFKKKHRDWKEVLKTLQACYEHQCELKDAAKKKGCFVPQEKNLQTYINQRCWEEEPQFAPPAKAKEDYNDVMQEVLLGASVICDQRRELERQMDEARKNRQNECDYEPF